MIMAAGAVEEGWTVRYVRYVDDFALFHDDLAVLGEWRQRIDRYLEGRRLKLHPRKTVTLPTAEPVAFLGYVLAPDKQPLQSRSDARGRRRLPEDNVRRFRGRLRALRDRWRSGTASAPDIVARVGAWIAHAEQADTWRLRQAIFKGGWFTPR